MHGDRSAQSVGVLIGRSPIQTPTDGLVDLSILHKAFAILGCFRTDAVLGVSELSRRTGLPRTTVYRLVGQLTAEGALQRVGTKYRVGATLFELGSLHFPDRLAAHVQPVLEDLQRISGGDAALLELVGNDAVVTLASRHRDSRSSLMRAGRTIPAHACAGGLVLLAERTTRRVPSNLCALTASTVVDPVAVRARLDDIRARRVAVEHGECETGRTSVAVPVVNRHGKTLGALMVMVPTHRIDLDVILSTLTTFAPILTRVGQKANIGFFASVRPKP